MKTTIAAAILAIASLPSFAATPGEMTSRELAKACKSYKPICTEFINETYDWMLKNENLVGPLCDYAAGHNFDMQGRPLNRTPADILARNYLQSTNNAWFGSFSARAATIRVIQGFLACKL